jgi:peptide/nickel transport system ATP-binding protein
MSAVLVVDQLSVRLPPGADREFAVAGVSLHVAAGEIVCLVGESGSGKSVTAFASMGLLAPELRISGGQIHLAGESVLDASASRLRALRGARMSMIFQEPMTALNPVMSCGAQLDELLRQHTRLGAAARRNQALAMLDEVRLPDPAGIYAAYPHQLSGGQRQRIMIAMALLLRPALLIADEPTTALDVTTQAEILRLIRELQQQHGSAVLFITHDFGVVADIADGVAVLQHGRLVESGAARELLAHPQHPYSRALLAAVPDLIPKKLPLAPGEPSLMGSGLRRDFGGGWFSRRKVRAVDDVTIAVRRGETVGVVGESGSGKSTLARLLARLIDTDAGAIEIDGSPAANLPRGEFRRRVQVVFQDPYRSLNPRRTAGAAIAEGPRNFGASAEEARRRAGDMLELVQLDRSAARRYPHQFSGGQRQRICIARALAVHPSILIADEAVSALDVSVQAEVLRLIEDLQQHLDLGVLFITHDLRVAAQICHRVVVMQHGRVVEQGPAAHIYAQPNHDYTRTLLAAAPGRGMVLGGRN